VIRAPAKKNLLRKNRARIGVHGAPPQPVDNDTFIAKFPANQSVFVQGEPCDALYYLRIGVAKVAVTSKSGREAVIVILDPGDFFGEGCILDNAPRADRIASDFTAAAADLTQ
jgi:CRP-like cAMP-binding protein